MLLSFESRAVAAVERCAARWQGDGFFVGFFLGSTGMCRGGYSNACDQAASNTSPSLVHHLTGTAGVALAVALQVIALAERGCLYDPGPCL